VHEPQTDVAPVARESDTIELQPRAIAADRSPRDTRAQLQTSACSGHCTTGSAAAAGHT
jgi:hypothetical protein